jgi:diacylglycerol O-acyltransferase / wax synthase
MSQIGGQDAQFLFGDAEHSFANVAVILIFGPPTGARRKLDFETLIEHVRSRLHTSPVFRRRLERVPFNLDFPYWVDDEQFDIEHHVHYSGLPRPGTWSQFTHFVSHYHHRPMDMHRPLWEICMVDGLDAVEGIPAGSFALIVKAHHSAIDGVSSVNFFAALTDSDERGTPAVDVAVQVQAAGVAPGTSAMLKRALANSLRSPFRMLDSVRRAAPDLAPRVLKRDRHEPVAKGSRAPATRFNTTLTGQKHFDACWFRLSDFKQVRQSVERATINDVVLAVCGGALRRYLLAHKELPDTSLVAWVPINARPKGVSGAEVVGNQITAMMAPLGTDLEDPHERLRTISRHTRRSKEGRSGVPIRLAVDMFQYLPAYAMAFVAQLMSRANALVRTGNVVITNVPGPQTPLYIEGSKCLHYLGLTPLADGLGLCIGTPSYNGELAFTVHSTTTMIPDMEHFIRCVREAFDELRDTSRQAGSSDVSRGRGTTSAKRSKRRHPASPRGGRSSHDR